MLIMNQLHWPRYGGFLLSACEMIGRYSIIQYVMMIYVYADVSDVYYGSPCPGCSQLMGFKTVSKKKNETKAAEKGYLEFRM